MSVTDNLRQVDWSNPDNKEIGKKLLEDALEYMKRVEDHIYTGNDIRADSFMDFSEKQESIAVLDRKRTRAHNKMLESFKPFLEILSTETDFNADDYALDNRTQIADFLATIAFEVFDTEPVSRIEGSVRDELAEKIHNRDISYEQIKEKLAALTM